MKMQPSLSNQKDFYVKPWKEFNNGNLKNTMNLKKNLY